MSSLAHTRAGITDAMFTVGAIEILIGCLHSENEQVIGTYLSPRTMFNISNRQYSHHWLIQPPA